ncbi:MAG: hypothetical protein M1832_005960 [Thelocarpon impressellum]|nr:MAG: hypothetical protein M1832_005960 [Thelocarpon impressellum]
MSATPIKAGRRVLGELGINAVTPSKAAKSLSAAKWTPPGGKGLLVAPSPVSSRKRSFDQLDDVPSKPAARLEAGVHVDEDVDMQASVKRKTSSEDGVDETPPFDRSTSVIERSDSAEDDQLTPRPADSPLPGEEAVSDAPQGSQFKIHAETLQLRLRVAMFKVQTDQVAVPLGDLKLLRRSETTVKDNVADAASPRQEPGRRLLPPLSLAPAPRRAPTDNLPSSPPDSAGRDVAFATPLLPRDRKPTVQLSSPPDSEAGEETTAEINLTSSVVKGRAATGLLELMRMG